MGTMGSHNKVVEIIATELEVEQEVVSDDCTLEGLGVTSPELLEIALAIEEEFGIEVSDETLADFQKVGDIITYVSEQKGA